MSWHVFNCRHVQARPDDTASVCLTIRCLTILFESFRVTIQSHRSLVCGVPAAAAKPNLNHRLYQPGCIICISSGSLWYVAYASFQDEVLRTTKRSFEDLTHRWARGPQIWIMSMCGNRFMSHRRLKQPRAAECRLQQPRLT